MNRAELKYMAKQAMAQARPGVISMTLLYQALPILLAAVAGGSSWAGLRGTGLAPGRNLTASALVLLVSVLYSVVEAGYAKYCLMVFRGQPAEYGTLFDFINRPFRFIGLGLLIGLATAGVIIVGAIALLIPILGVVVYLAALGVGVYIALGFSQAVLVAVDRPELGITECMRESWDMMTGRRGELFVLGLSFILWGLLCVFIIPLLWVVPYQNVTFAGYYCHISGAMDPPQEPDEPPIDAMWRP